MIHTDRMVRHNAQPVGELRHHIGAEMFRMAGHDGVEIGAGGDQILRCAGSFLAHAFIPEIINRHGADDYGDDHEGQAAVEPRKPA